MAAGDYEPTVRLMYRIENGKWKEGEEHWEQERAKFGFPSLYGDGEVSIFVGSVKENPTDADICVPRFRRGPERLGESEILEVDRANVLREFFGRADKPENWFPKHLTGISKDGTINYNALMDTGSGDEDYKTEYVDLAATKLNGNAFHLWLGCDLSTVEDIRLSSPVRIPGGNRFVRILRTPEQVFVMDFFTS